MRGAGVARIVGSEVGTVEPLVSGGVIAAYRASLVALDQWDYVREAFGDQEAFREEAWLDTVSGADWVDLAAYLALLDAVGRTLGLDELRSLTRRRIADPAGSNFYSTTLRAWARSFGDSPAHMLRGVVHAWRAGQRNTGTMRVHEIADHEVQLVIEGPVADAYRSSQPLCVALEGLALGFLDQAQPRPVFLEVELAAQAAQVALICRFHG